MFSLKTQKLFSKIIAVIFIIGILFIHPVYSPVAKATTIVSEIQTLANGKKVIMVDGKPFQTYGVQLRPDTWRKNLVLTPIGINATNTDMTNNGMFKSAKMLNANCVQVPILWSDCEPSQGTFDWTNLDWAISECNKYGLRMEILWFGTSVCGVASDYVTARYIIDGATINNANDPVPTYERVRNSSGAAINFDSSAVYPNRVYNLCVEDADLQSAEHNVINNLMNHLESYDANHAVIGFQVENEASITGFSATDRCHCTTCNALYTQGGYQNGSDFAKARCTNYLNTVAGWVKSASRKIYTRVNFVDKFYNYEQNVQALASMNPKNVDFIGYDNYGKTQSENWDILTNSSYLSYPGNIPHVAEQQVEGVDDLREKIVDVCAANGCGCELYRNDAYIVANRPAHFVDNYLYYLDGTNINDARANTDDVRNTFGQLQKAMYYLTTLKNGYNNEIQYYNSSGATTKIYSDTKVVNGKLVVYTTSNQGIGIAFPTSGYITLMNVGYAPSSFTISDLNPSTCETGYYDNDGIWYKEDDKGYTTNDTNTYTVNMKPYEVVRVSIDSATNLAIGKTATMLSGNPGWGHVASHAIDGDTNTYAQSDSDVLWGLSVDLGSQMNINRVDLCTFSANYPQQFTIQVSTDNTNWSTVATETNNNGSTRAYNFNTISCRYVKMNVTARNNWNLTIREFGIYNAVAAKTNLALGKTASMNTTAFTGHPASNAIDGNLSTYAQSNSNVPWDLTVDLGSSMNINNVVINMATFNCAKDFTIKTSTDNINWTTVATESGGGTFTRRSYTFNSTLARYVMMDVTTVIGGGSDYGHAIFDFEVYNKPVINLAAGKTASMDTTAYYGHPAGDAIDDSLSTIAQSNSNTPWDLTVDLGSQMSVDNVVVNMGTFNCAKEFTIMTSTDNTNWVTAAYETEGGTFTRKAYNFVPVSCRYVKMAVTSVICDGSDYGHAIMEFEIYNISYSAASNLLAGKTASMSTSAYTGHAASAAIDGKPNTYAMSDNNAAWSLTGDLGSTKSINTVALTTGNDLFLDKGPNLALGKTASMNFTQYWTDYASNAVDGDFRTFARSDGSDIAGSTGGYTNTDNPWDLTIDLGANTTFNRVEYSAGTLCGNCPLDFTIQVSTDNTNWTTVATETPARSDVYCALEVKNFSINAVTARYVRINVTRAVGGWKSSDFNGGYWLREVGIYNTPVKPGYAVNYTIQTSTDNTNWTTVSTVTGSIGIGQKLFKFSTISARYVKVNVTSVNGGGSTWGHAIRELAVYNR